jgi:ABC-type Na+ efflux pump permease subunit
MYGAMFVAVGAAVSNAKEAQSFITPIMLIVIIPTMMLAQIIQSPSGLLAQIFGYFPTSAPMVMMARLSVPPGIPSWQPVIAMIGVLLTTLLLVWCAGRIFRVGILMQGQGARPLEMLKWIVRG